ncbi:30860_t:CDS:10 [Racocetra persica]|uniref:30860_t:CDS:1 n=1 Tax=Racocetra persica TaxID=160502 RepID=A0ACA9KIF0_9GLOM|nr:30860_t:CDS:10 [Racocetra persica]
MTEQSPTKSSIKTEKNLNVTMMAVEWHGTTDVRVNMKRPRPVITKPTDTIVRITATTICGSDLHLYHKGIPRVAKGDVMGYEGMGIIHEVGRQVSKYNVGDRVVISSVIACGSCGSCRRGLFSCCDIFNPNDSGESAEKFHGTQAEYVRVPFADINLIHISDEESQILMEKALLLSSVACKGLHACEMSKVLKGDIVGIWGAGPVGIMCAAWAKYLGASRVIVIDSVPSRLQVALKIEGIEIINCKEDKDVVGKIKVSVPGGLDIAIDAVGNNYVTKSFIGKLEKALFADTESCDALDEAILCTKRGGSISLIGDYNTFTNHFRIDAIMDKSLSIRGGKSHTPKAYKKLDKKEEGIIKIFLIVDEKEFPHLITSFASGSRTSTVAETASKSKTDEVVETVSETSPREVSESVSDVKIVMSVPNLSTEPIDRVSSEPVRRSSFESNGLVQDTSSAKSLSDTGCKKEEIHGTSQSTKNDINYNEFHENGSHKKDEVKND